jgi:hypothetical protein
MNNLYYFVLLVAIISCSANKLDMLNANKTPKKAAATLSDACTECKTLVQRFNDAVKDPSKVEELKILLTLLCEQTSYVEECKVFVSKLDYFIAKFKPYMQDPQAFCTRLHMCGNARLEHIHQFALLYAKKYMNRVDGVATNDFVCDECQYAVQELKNVVEDRSTQDQIKQFVSDEICKRLGKYQGSCDLIVTDVLPSFFEEMEKFLQNSKQVCLDLHLCTANAEKSFLPTKTRGIARHRGPIRVNSFMQMINSLQTKSPNVYMTCLECELAVDVLLAEINQPAHVETWSTDIREFVCHKLPASFFAGCEDFVGLYMPSVLQMTLNQFSANDVCRSLNVCTAEKLNAIKRLSTSQKSAVACESCKGITALMRRELVDAHLRTEMQHSIEEYLCRDLPSSMTNLCYNLVESHASVFIDKLVEYVNSPTICKDDLHKCTKTDAELQHIE